MRTVATIAATTLLLAACAGQRPVPAAATPHPSPVPLRIATTARDDSQGAALSGVLGGRANPDGTACFWVHNDAAPGGVFPAVDTAILWPGHLRAYAGPLRVVDDAGHVVAAVGQPVYLRGGFLDQSQLPLLGCVGFIVAFG